MPLFDQGYDIVIGSRGLGRKNFSLFRRLASAIFHEFRRSLLLPKIIDTQAGFKAMRLPVAKEIFPLLQIFRHHIESTSGWKVTAFDVELLVAAQRRGYKVTEVEIDWEDRDISKGKSKGTLKFVHESFEMIQETLRVKLNDLRGDYKK